MEFREVSLEEIAFGYGYSNSTNLLKVLALGAMTVSMILRLEVYFSSGLDQFHSIPFHSIPLLSKTSKCTLILHLS